MSEVLSQSEIDALLLAVSSGSVDTAENEAEKNDWVAYDLTSQEKIYHGRLAGLEGIHERFARLFRVSLSNFFKKNVTVSATNTDYLKFGDYLSNLLRPTSLNVLSIPSLQGHMVMMMTSKLVYALLDGYYGGVERPFAKLGGRDEFTSIENNIIRKICELGIKDLEEAWRLNYPIQVQYSRMESNPAFVGSIHTTDVVAVVTFEVEFEHLSGPFTLVIQLRALDPIQSHLSVHVTNEHSRDNSTWAEHWMNEIMQLPLEIRAELGNADLNVANLKNWKAGEVITLTQDAASPLAVFIEDVPKMKGMMGLFRGNTAVRVTEMESVIQKGKKNG
jgi:flagellar motor switch protein FliM